MSLMKGLLFSRAFSMSAYQPGMSFFKSGSILTLRLINPRWRTVESKNGESFKVIARQGALLFTIMPKSDEKARFDISKAMRMSLNSAEIASLTANFPDGELAISRESGKQLLITEKTGKYYIKIQSGSDHQSSFLTAEEMHALRLMAPTFISHCNGFDKLHEADVEFVPESK